MPKLRREYTLRVLKKMRNQRLWAKKKMRNQRFRIYIQMSSYSQIFITLFLRFSRFPNL